MESFLSVVPSSWKDYLMADEGDGGDGNLNKLLMVTLAISTISMFTISAKTLSEHFNAKNLLIRDVNLDLNMSKNITVLLSSICSLTLIGSLIAILKLKGYRPAKNWKTALLLLFIILYLLFILAINKL